MKNINESFITLQTLLNQAKELIHPIDYSYELKFLLKQDNRKKLFEDNPKCILPINVGRQIPFLPVCNRSAMFDPNIIDLSLKMANKLIGNEFVEQNQLFESINKLKQLKNKYSNKKIIHL